MPHRDQCWAPRKGCASVSSHRYAIPGSITQWGKACSVEAGWPRFKSQHPPDSLCDLELDTLFPSFRLCRRGVLTETDSIVLTWGMGNACPKKSIVAAAVGGGVCSRHLIPQISCCSLGPAGETGLTWKGKPGASQAPRRCHK